MQKTDKRNRIKEYRDRINELEDDIEIAKDSRAVVDKALRERRVQVEALLAENQLLRDGLETLAQMCSSEYGNLSRYKKAVALLGFVPDWLGQLGAQCPPEDRAQLDRMLE